MGTSKILNFIRKNIIYIILFIVFLFASFVIWKRAEVKESAPKQISEVKKNTSQYKKLEETTKALRHDLGIVHQQILSLEQRTVPPQVPMNKLICVELYRGVLDASIPIQALKAFLSRIPENWAQSHLGTINPIQECLTYVKLDHLLSVPQNPDIPREKLTLWERISRQITALISIRKVDSKGGYTYGQLEDIHNDLLNHDITKAIASYKKLPDTEKHQLAVWFQAAQDRQRLEFLLTQILLELSQGGTP